MGSNPSRKIPLLGIAHPVEGKNYFRYQRRTWGWDASETLEAKKWSYVALLCIFVKIWAKDPILDNLYSKQIVIELFLYKIYILCCMDVWVLLGRFTHVWVL